MQVNGIAVDWLSGSLYWTDALYNWISVCDSQRFDYYRHLVTTKLDKPIGITVHPQKGYDHRPTVRFSMENRKPGMNDQILLFTFCPQVKRILVPQSGC